MTDAPHIADTVGRDDSIAPRTMFGVLCSKLLGLGRDEDGAALVITLAIFFLMYLGCMGVYAISMAVKERIQLQNAADAAAYSAAVVQADTLSRIATINRAMSWTYVDMTRHQMDYIVRRWLGHTCDHYEMDMNGGEDEKGHKHDSLSDYNKNSILYKNHIKLSPFGPNEPCSLHRSFGVGYYIGADDVSPLMVHLNGRDSSKYRMPRDAKNVGLPRIPAGHNELEALVRAKLVVNDAEYVLKYASIIPRLTACLPNDLATIVRLTHDCFSDLSPSAMTRIVLLDNLTQAQNIDLSAGGDVGVPLLMKHRINIDKFSIAKMNVCERYLALDLPNRVEACVRDVLEANLSSFESSAIMYTIQQSKALGDELAGQLPSYVMSFNRDLGYLRDVFNTERDENRFLSFSNYSNIYDTFEAGVNQWFVRGNGNHRAGAGDYGIQRCYKHMTKSWIAYDKITKAEEPLSSFHATHSPLEPTSWNTKKLEDADASCALFSEWMWWSDTWYCFKVWIPYPPGYITIHLNLPHYKEIWPSKPSCSHHSKPGLLGLKSGELTMPDWSSFFSVGSLTSEAKSYCIKKRKWRPPKFRSHDYTPKIDFGLWPLIKKLASLDNLLGNYEPIEEYHDGCFIWPDLFSPRDSICKFTGYSRLYADDPHLYNRSYVGVKAMPLVLDSSYFGKAGTISVGIRRKNENVFLRILKKIEGIFTAFDPDWNDGEDTHTYVFASAKAGYKDKGEDADSRQYKIDWQPNNQDWNLCQSDWDAVFVPVRKAYSYAISGMWFDGDGDMLFDWVVSRADEWKPVAGKGVEDYMSRNVYAPRGVLRGNGHDGKLKWRELSHVMYH